MPGDLTDSADVLALYEEQFDQKLPLVAKLSPEFWATPLEFFGIFNYPAALYLQFMLNHSIHHRGQLTAYLREMGAKVPNIYGGSYDEPMPMPRPRLGSLLFIAPGASSGFVVITPASEISQACARSSWLGNRHRSVPAVRNQHSRVPENPDLHRAGRGVLALIPGAQRVCLPGCIRAQARRPELRRLSPSCVRWTPQTAQIALSHRLHT